MCLPMPAEAIECQQYGVQRRIIVRGDAHTIPADSFTPLVSEDDDDLICTLRPCNNSDDLFINLVCLSLVIARDIQARGGVLIHGALAERDGSGVLLAAPGGTGKTTASNRLPASWSSLCDDTTLVLPDPHGNYWAHPWPTWSRFLYGGNGGVWDVQRAVPLKVIFFLAQADADRTERVGAGQAASSLMESAKQASLFMRHDLCQEKSRDLQLKCFNNLCALARVIPAHVLHISLTGAFWKEIEQVIDVGDPSPTVPMTR